MTKTQKSQTQNNNAATREAKNAAHNGQSFLKPYFGIANPQSFGEWVVGNNDED